MRVILPVGGHGSRLAPIYGAPKAQLPLADTDFLGYETDVFRESGHIEFLLMLHDEFYDECLPLLRNMGEVQRYEGNGETQMILGALKDLILREDAVVTSHTDMVYSSAIIREMTELYRRNSASVVPVVEQAYPTGGYVFNTDIGRFEKISGLKKCLTVQPLYVLTREFLEFMLQEDVKTNIVELFNKAIEQRIPIEWYRTKEPIINANYPWEYIQANQYAIRVRNVEKERVNLRVGRIDETCSIDRTAIITNSIIMEGATIGAGTRLRNSVIGRNCNVGDNVGIEDIEGEISISDPKGYGDVKIESEELGLYVGDNSQIGDGIVLKPGTRILSRSILPPKFH